MAIAPDGSVYYINPFGVTATVALPGLTTTQAGDIIVLAIANLNSTITSVTGATIGSFTKLDASSGSTPPLMELWACYASAALTGEVVTVVQGSAYDCRYDLFALSGSNQTSLIGAFETAIHNELGAFNGSLPQNYTTTHANAAIIGTTLIGFSTVAGAANNGFAFVITPVDTLATVYKVLSATGTHSISTDQDNLAQCMIGIALIQASSGTTGTLAVTEAKDVAAITAGLGVIGTLASTEAKDVAAITGNVAWTGTLAVTEAKDVAALTGTVVIPATGTLAVTEATDVAAITAFLTASGTLAATEGLDTASISGSLAGAGVSGALAATEAPDAAVINATVRWNATLAATEAPDLAAITGLIANSGILVATEGKDVAAITGSIVLPAVTGILAATEQADTAQVIAQTRSDAPGVLYFGRRVTINRW